MDYTYICSGLKATSVDVLVPFPGPDRIEQCAVLFGAVIEGVRYVNRSLIVPNRHEHPDRYFRIHAADVGNPMGIVGVVHTHRGRKDPGVSSFDVQQIAPTKFVGVIYNFESAALRVYDGSGWLHTRHHMTEWHYLHHTRRRET